MFINTEFNNLVRKFSNSLINFQIYAKFALIWKNQLVQNNFFMQNKANSSGVHFGTTSLITTRYNDFAENNFPKNKAKQSQFKPNFELKMGLFSQNKAKSKPICVNLGNFKGVINTVLICVTCPEQSRRDPCPIFSVNSVPSVANNNVFISAHSVLTNVNSSFISENKPQMPKNKKYFVKNDANNLLIK